jgi:hypothetical protein
LEKVVEEAWRARRGSKLRASDAEQRSVIRIFIATRFLASACEPYFSQRNRGMPRQIAERQRPELILQ